ncbi:unnamed protein product, partial [Iphiclides podalirius]
MNLSEASVQFTEQRRLCTRRDMNIQAKEANYERKRPRGRVKRRPPLAARRKLPPPSCLRTGSAPNYRGNAVRTAVEGLYIDCARCNDC